MFFNFHYNFLYTLCLLNCASNCYFLISLTDEVLGLWSNYSVSWGIADSNIKPWYQWEHLVLGFILNTFNLFPLGMDIAYCFYA